MNLPISDLAALAWSQIWQVTALAIVVGIVTRLVCRRRPHLAYALWMLVLLKCLTPPLWSSPTGLFSWARCRVGPASPDVRSGVADVPLAFNAEHGAANVLEEPERRNMSARPSAAIGPVEKISQIVAETPASSGRDRMSPAGIAAAVWVLGALGLAGLMGWRWRAYRRVLKRSTLPADAAVERLVAQLRERLRLRRAVRIVITSEPIGPAVFGLLRPVVVLPRAVVGGECLPSPIGRGAGGEGQATADAPEIESSRTAALTLTLSQRERGLAAELRLQQLEPILAHELVHLRRGDAYWGALQLAVEALWWFHPLVWWANRETCRQRERCCDHEVVAGLKFRPAAYARCLLDVLELGRNWQPLLAISAARSNKETSRRLEDIMNRSHSFHGRTPRWVWAALVVAAAVALPGGAMVLGQSENQTPPNRQGQPQPTTSVARENKATLHETTLTGQVVDPAGKGIAAAQVAAVGRLRNPSASSLLADDLTLLGATTADGEGRFRLNIPKLSSAAYYSAHAVAVADGCNLGWQPIGLDVAQPQVKVTLGKAQTIHGRLLDAKGQPAGNAKVYVTGFGKSLPGDFDGIQCWKPPSQLPFWPKPATTDRDGRFTLRGVDRSQILNVQVRDDRFAIDWIQIGLAGEKDAHATLSPSGEVTLSPPPARIFQGKITYDDTHQPVAKALVQIGASFDPFGCIMNMGGETVADGRFRLNPYSGKIFYVKVCPPAGEPYLTYEKEIKLADSQQPPQVEIALPRGVLLRGKISEKTTGEPVAGATLKYEDHTMPPYRRDRILPDHSSPAVRGITRSDGTYQIALPPGHGTLFVQGPNNDYIRQTINTWDFRRENLAYAQRHYVGAYTSLDLKPNQPPAEVDLAIRRGATVHGTIVGPDNQQPGDVLILSRHFLRPDEDTFRGGKILAEDGQFALHGLDPDVATPFYFLDPQHETGATVDISGRSADNGPLLVHLRPCGKAVARFVTPQGKPKAKHDTQLQIVVSPGPFSGDEKRNKKEVSSDQDFVANFDRQHYWRQPLTDAQGRCTFPALIPGATYRIPIFNKLGDWDEKDFTVKPGETLHLPDITVKTN